MKPPSRISREFKEKLDRLGESKGPENQRQFVLTALKTALLEAREFVKHIERNSFLLVLSEVSEPQHGNWQRCENLGLSLEVGFFTGLIACISYLLLSVVAQIPYSGYAIAFLLVAVNAAIYSDYRGRNNEYNKSCIQKVRQLVGSRIHSSSDDLREDTILLKADLARMMSFIDALQGVRFYNQDNYSFYRSLPELSMAFQRSAVIECLRALCAFSKVDPAKFEQLFLEDATSHSMGKIETHFTAAQNL